jgi:integrase
VDQAGELMARVDVPYVQRFKDRHGRVRHYFRKPGMKRIALPDPAEPTFAAAYHQALTGTKISVAISQTRPGTIGALLVEYYTSTEFRELKPITQRTYRNVLERFRADYGHNPVSVLTKNHVREMVKDKEGPDAKRNFLKRIRKVLDLAVDLDWIEHNPARAYKLKAHKTDGFIPWSDDDVAAFEARWPAGSRERRAMYLLLYTGQRRSDASRMGRQHVRDGKIKVVQDKGGATLWIPLHPALKAELELAPKDALAFIPKANGAPMSYGGFTNWFSECAREAGLTERTAHGLRKAAGYRLAEAGCTTKQIMAVLGHKTMKEAAHYTEAADQKRLADAAMTTWVEAGS